MGFSAEEFDLNFKPHRDQGGILIISFKLARIPCVHVQKRALFSSHIQCYKMVSLRYEMLAIKVKCMVYQDNII